jgi:hypothetical protein
MVRQTTYPRALVPFLVALLLAVLLPAVSPAGVSGDDGTSTVPVLSSPTGGVGDPASPNSGDPDELGIYGRNTSTRPTVIIPGTPTPVPTRDPVEPAPRTPAELVLQAFLLGLESLVPGF